MTSESLKCDFFFGVFICDVRCDHLRPLETFNEIKSKIFFAFEDDFWLDFFPLSDFHLIYGNSIAFQCP